jgi:RNA polymerase sigma factor (sigma-70 family)
MRLLAVAVAQLSEREREIVLLRYEGQTLDQVSQALGVSRQAVQQREPVIYAKLKAIMGRMGIRSVQDII